MTSARNTAVQVQDPLALGHDYHLEAQSVLALSPDPQNPFEVAVVLSTLGYTDAAAQSLGASGLFDLARRIYDVIDLHYRPPDASDEELPEAWHRRFRRALSTVAMGFSYAELWVLSLALLATTRLSFWSSTTLTGRQATAVNIALVAALVVSTPFVQAFSRKHVFFRLQSDWPLARWVTNVLIGGGALVTVLVLGGVYVLFEDVLHAYTPGSNRLFLGFALLIASLNLVLAPLYAMRSFLALFVALGTGAAVIVVTMPGDWQQLLSQAHMVRLQVVSLIAVEVVALALGLFVRRRMERREPDPVRESLRPRLPVFLLATAPYVVYGAALYVLVFAHKFIAGGALAGGYSYRIGYEAAVGLGAAVLVPVLVVVTVTMECFARDVSKALKGITVARAAEFDVRMRRLYRRRLTVLLAVVAASGAAVWLLGAHVRWPLRIPADGLRSFPVAVAGYAVLGVGLFHAQWLFYISRPAPVLYGLGAGIALSLACGVAGQVWGAPAGGAVWGLLAGSAVFAAVTCGATLRSLANFDRALYAAL